MLVSAPCWLTQTWMLYVPGAHPDVFHAQVLDVENPCMRCQMPLGSWSQNSYTGTEQPEPLAVKVTDAPLETELDEAVNEADVQPVRLTVLEPYASRVEVEPPLWMAHTWTA